MCCTSWKYQIAIPYLYLNVLIKRGISLFITASFNKTLDMLHTSICRNLTHDTCIASCSRLLFTHNTFLYSFNDNSFKLQITKEKKNRMDGSDTQCIAAVQYYLRRLYNLIVLKPSLNPTKLNIIYDKI